MTSPLYFSIRLPSIYFSCRVFGDTEREALGQGVKLKHKNIKRIYASFQCSCPFLKKKYANIILNNRAWGTAKVIFPQNDLLQGKEYNQIKENSYWVIQNRSFAFKPNAE